MTKFVTYNGIKLVLGLLALVVFSAACAAKEEPAATPRLAATQAPVVKATPTPVPAVAPVPTAAPASVRPTHWTWALLANPTVNLDPIGPTIVSETQSYLFDWLIYDGGPDLKVENILASDWKFTTPTQMRFSLKKNVKFHSGDPLTAEDVKYTWDSAISDAKIWYSPSFRAEVQSVDVVDPYTVNLNFKRPFGPTMYYVQRAGIIVPKLYRQKVGPEEFKKNPVGTGPYKLTSNQVDQKIDLEANKDYFLGPVFPPKMTFIWIREATTRTAAVLAGTVDAADGIAHEEVPRLEKEQGLQVLQTGQQKNRIHFNYGDPPFNNEKLRQALNYAVDKDAIVNDLMEGRADILAGPFIKGNMGYDPNLKPYPYDPNKARSLLKEAGLTGTSFEFTSSSGVKPKDREVSQLLASYWETVGLKPQLKFITREQYFETKDTRTFQVSNCCLWGNNKDMAGEVDWDYLSTGFRVNRALTSDTPLAKELQGLWNKQAGTVDEAERDQIFRQIGQFVYDHALTVNTHAHNLYIALNRKLDWHQYPKTSLSGYYLNDRWFTMGLKPVPIFKTQ